MADDRGVEEPALGLSKGPLFCLSSRPRASARAEGSAVQPSAGPPGRAVVARIEVVQRCVRRPKIFFLSSRPRASARAEGSAVRLVQHPTLEPRTLQSRPAGQKMIARRFNGGWSRKRDRVPRGRHTSRPDSRSQMELATQPARIALNGRQQTFLRRQPRRAAPLRA